MDQPGNIAADCENDVDEEVDAAALLEKHAKWLKLFHFHLQSDLSTFGSNRYALIRFNVDTHWKDPRADALWNVRARQRHDLKKGSSMKRGFKWKRHKTVTPFEASRARTPYKSVPMMRGRQPLLSEPERDRQAHVS